MSETFATDIRSADALPAAAVVKRDLPRASSSETARVLDPLQPERLESEVRFYRGYSWCLNARPRLGEAIEHLRQEVTRLEQVDEEWQRAEVRTNVFLLACAITDTVDDHLIGTRYDFSQVANVLPMAGLGLRVVGAVSNASCRARRTHLRRIHRWRKAWKLGVSGFLRDFMAAERSETHRLQESAERLIALAGSALPENLQHRRVRIPAAFRTQDHTHTDLFSLAQALAAACPDRGRPIVVVGLRTAGSYFAPLVCAWLANAGYEDVDWVTIRPARGMAPWERAALANVAHRGGLAALVDEAPNTCSTLAKAVALVRATGFTPDSVALLVPVHPTRPDWAAGHRILPLAGTRILTLEPDAWRKRQWLEPEAIEARVAEYVRGRGYSSATVVAGAAAAARFNQYLRYLSDEKFHTRLKRVYEVRLCHESGRSETRYVIAKSVGWGWLGYHAFVAAGRLEGFVPPVLGLRNGILYAEWIPSDDSVQDVDRTRVVAALASYVAARVSRLALESDPSSDFERGDQHKGFTLLATALSGAHGWKPAAMLRRAGIHHALSRETCPRPALIDGKMRQQEWLVRGAALLKSDFEHHGLGKTELNITDPAYDLADAILHFRLSPAEERVLVRRYVEQSDDRRVEDRLFLHKLLAGAWARHGALDNLSDGRLARRHHEFNTHYLEAGQFLTVHTTRHCAGLCHQPRMVGWRSPLVVLDIDGVLDKQIFGFPSTTAAGIHAVSLLHSHGLAVAVNTARTLPEVREYCEAYGFVGGVAEYGGAVWDAVTGRERWLVSDETMEQLARIRVALLQIPGVFLDDGHRVSIRAYTFERGVTIPLPTLLVRKLMADLAADRVTFHQTFTDTTIIPMETDKGRGLRALLEHAGQPDLETYAVGDSEADLPMFRTATRSFAPSHLGCRAVARLLGCRVMDRPFQLGFLAAARAIVHPGGDWCSGCRTADPWRMKTATGLFADLLRAADQPRWRLMLRALLDPTAVQVFAK